MNSGGCAILIRKDILGPSTSTEHEEIFLGRHLVRIRHLDCSCTVVYLHYLHYQPNGSLQELRLRLRAAAARWPTCPDGVGFLVGATSTFAIQMREDSTLAARPSAMATLAVQLPSSPPSPALWKLRSLTSHGRTKDVMFPPTRVPASTAFSSIFRLLSCVTSSAILRPLGPLVRTLCPVTTCLSGPR